MDEEFLKELVVRCRGLAEKADGFTRIRLLTLVAKYETILHKRRAQVIKDRQEPEPKAPSRK
jgi:hypothetical protein